MYGYVQVWEELCWLVRMTAHILADPGEGETPVVPESMGQASRSAAESGGSDPVEALSQQLLAAARLTGSAATRALVSPRVLEALLWALSRWADTYLMPEDSGSSIYAAMHLGTNAPEAA